jgi:hypothetical protein
MIKGINYTHIQRHKWKIFVKIGMNVRPLKIIISWHVSLMVNKIKQTFAHGTENCYHSFQGL